mmetsp:Transcript_2465/g.5246  ORF Transcript_2465/g.5246 Transcript_2465/m.5246 type:complete len:92 (+) Transcript_2465:345-620(+)
MSGFPRDVKEGESKGQGAEVIYRAAQAPDGTKQSSSINLTGHQVGASAVGVGAVVVAEAMAAADGHGLVAVDVAVAVFACRQQRTQPLQGT